MPYRRRARGRYYGRRTAKPTTWVRNDDTHATRIDTNKLVGFDLLAPLHTADSVLKVGGQYDSAPSTTGRTCVRIIGQMQMRWRAAELAAFEPFDGAYVGIHAGVWTHDTASREVDLVALPANSYHPWDPQFSANLTDWCYWDRKDMWEEMNTTDAELSGTDDDMIGVWRFDVRAKRALRELGETMIFSCRPIGSGTSGIETIRVTTSVLLR